MGWKKIEFHSMEEVFFRKNNNPLVTFLSVTKAKLELLLSYLYIVMSFAIASNILLNGRFRRTHTIYERIEGMILEQKGDR